MNVFLSILRRISLGGFIILILSLVLKGGIPKGYLGWFLLLSPVLYLLFMFFTWLSAKHTTEDIEEMLGVDLESNNYGVTLARGLGIDLISPIGVIVGLFKDSSTKVVMFVSTYIIILAYVVIWFFIIR